MKNFKLKFRGESLTEVLVAVGILGAVLVTSFILLNRGISTSVTVKNKILAINIAREGIEGVRNIRDTNWLKYSGDRRNKWLCYNTNYNNNWDKECGNNIYEYFSIDFDENHKSFFLKDPDGLNDTIESQELLNLKDTSTDWSEYRLYKDSNSRYTHNAGTLSNPNPATIFYRQIKLIAETPPECDGSPNTEANCSANSRLHVISRVQWREPLISGENPSASDLIGTVVMETYLYDYLGRNEY